MNTQHFNALLTFDSNDAHEMQTPVSSGYRARLQFSIEQEQVLGIFNFPDQELVFPGDTVTAEISVLNSESIIEKLYKGLDFNFYTDEMIVGHGLVTHV